MGERLVLNGYADFHQMALARKKAMSQGLHAYLGIRENLKIYLDNGAFYFLKLGGETPVDDYVEFVYNARPDWYPVPQDFIPIPSMSPTEQEECFQLTMASNHAYAHGNFVLIMHLSPKLTNYTVALSQHPALFAKRKMAIGGIVPNLLRSPVAVPHRQIITNLQSVRQLFVNQSLHIFGLGGTATLHLTTLLRIDSADSSGWRNCAARGIIQLPGSGDRTVADLGSWRGRTPSQEEWLLLEQCSCPACQQFGLAGLRANRVFGFRNRATHNLWVLLQEIHWIEHELTNQTYQNKFQARLDNSHYLPLISQIVSTSFPSCGVRFALYSFQNFNKSDCFDFFPIRLIQFIILNCNYTPNLCKGSKQGSWGPGTHWVPCGGYYRGKYSFLLLFPVHWWPWGEVRGGA